MTAEDDVRFETLFHKALEKEPSEREAFLDIACQGDAALKDKLKRLLAAHHKSSDFLDRPAWSMFLQETGKGASTSEDLTPEAGLPYERLGEYRLIRRIGEGGMGVVYLAMQESLSRLVALKVLRGERKGSFEAEARFQREGEAISELNHPSIVTVYGSGEDQGVRYFAMEWVPGKGLNEILFDAAAKEEKVPLKQSLIWVKQIAEALQCAHERGIIHRDVKPSNIRITGEGQPKLLDFSVARHVDLAALTLTGEFCGTPHYAAPEQVSARNKGIDARTDVYTLGVTLYEAATGRIPFQGETTEQVFHQILEKEPVRPLRLNPEMPHDLETVILTAMDKDPDRRYQTMVDFAGDIKRLMAGEMIMAKPAGFPTKIVKRIRRNPAMSAATGVALVALIALAISLPSYYRQKSRNQPLEDLQFLSRLQQEVPALWPARPEIVPRVESWIEEAAALEGRLETYRKELETLRAAAKVPAKGEEKPSDWIFEDKTMQSRHDTLSELVRNLETFTDPASGVLSSVKVLCGFARTMKADSVDKYLEEWTQTIDALADPQESQPYRGLKLDPLVGLVPLGRDPRSGLFEFAHLQTGRVPERDPDGVLQYGEEHGLVFVLLPGGTFQMGVEKPDADHPPGDPNIDPHAKDNEGPVHPVALEPFLISKYEMTQAQWVRFMGYNTSHYLPECNFGGKQHSLLHPLENVTWEEARRVLAWLNLRLPSEAEWEYAARGGTASVWWTGNEKESLAGAANLMDRTCQTYQGATEADCEEWLDDGYVVHSPVNAFRANPFGIHDVCGNSYEWCEDAWHSRYEDAPADGSAWLEPGSSIRVCRNACWDGAATTCRIAYRIWRDKGYKDCGLGVRPAASLKSFLP